MTISTIRNWLRRAHDESAPTDSAVGSVSTARVLNVLPQDTVITLAGLYEAPPSVTQAVVQLLPFGSRAALATYGVVVESPIAGDATNIKSLSLTPFGFEVITAAARKLGYAPADVGEDVASLQELADRWERAAFPQPD